MLLRKIARAIFSSGLHSLKTVKVGHRFTDSGLGKWVAGSGAAIAQLQYGASAVVFLDEYIGRSMYLWGEYDPRISALIKATLRPGDTMIDIGANFGVTGLLACQCVGPDGNVHLFEPQPVVAQCLRTSLAINGFQNAHLHECALSNSSGPGEMTVQDPTNMGMTSLSPRELDNGNNHGSVKVRIERTDDYISSLGLEGAQLIKIDVEGHEFVILDALRGWLARSYVPVILFECHLHGEDLDDHPGGLLAELGYEILCLDTRPYWKTRLYRPSQNRPISGYDFVAIRWNQLDTDRYASFKAMLL